MERTEVRDIVSEVRGAELPDSRLRDRLEKMVQALESKPDGSFPEVFRNESDLEAFYRFVRNDRVHWGAVLAPHIRETARRCSEHETVIVAHDTTEFRFGGQNDREGLARGGRGRSGSRSKQGFLAHCALAIGLEHRAPLGVLALHPWARMGKSRTGRRKEGGATQEELQAMPNEQDRWWQIVCSAEESLREKNRIIHVMDSEADDYALLTKLTRHSSRFVIRMCYDRVLADRLGRTKEFVSSGQVVCTSKVTVGARAPSSGRTKRRHEARVEREATLVVRASRAEFRRPENCARDYPASLATNIVYVQELDPPEDVEPLEWLLVTSEPITTQEDILKVIAHYRCRWRIEEFFKAIKTGCAFEKRQLESLDRLLIALAMFIPIAWQLLLLRTLSRSAPTQPALGCLTERQLEVLKLATKLPENPTVRDALLQIARLGGHLKRNGEPGWQTLGRGFLELLALERGFMLQQM